MGISTSVIHANIQKQSFSFHVAQGTEGSAALAAAESQDGYLAQVAKNRPNAIARQSMNYSANRLTLAQADLLRDKIEEFKPHIPPVLHSIKPTVVALMPSADGGMPHTRPSDLVCLPQSASSLTLSTFVHELWHLHQRAHSREWNSFFEKQWKWKIFEGDMDPELEKMRRLNPDTLADPLWIWNNEWVPICLFLNPSSPSFQDTATWFFNARTGSHTRDLPNGMRIFFSDSLSPSAYEHPNEVSAYMLTGRALSCEAYRLIINHLSSDALIQ